MQVTVPPNHTAILSLPTVGARIFRADGISYWRITFLGVAVSAQKQGRVGVLALWLIWSSMGGYYGSGQVSK